MDKTKIRLSPEEIELVNNAGIILTKNRILQKINELFSQVLLDYQQVTLPYAHKLPQETFNVTPKISKGENYRGLPYLVLDYPRCFRAQDVLAIRTMFWWGNFFSITLHLAGRYKKECERKIVSAFPSLANNNFYCCVNSDPWQHHFEDDNYLAIKEISPTDYEKIISEKPFLKLAAKFGLQQWEHSSGLLQENFRKLVEIVAD